jgi:hypothetical protein
VENIKRVTVLSFLVALIGLSGCVVADRDRGYDHDHEHDRAWHDRCDHPHEHDDYCYR